MDTGLQNTTVLITGASGGIGLETCKLFLQQGARVFAQYNTNADAFANDESLRSHIQSGRLSKIHADLTSESQVEDLFQIVSSYLQNIGLGPSEVPVAQVLVINHGIWPSYDVPLKDMTLKQWNRTLDVNLTASFLVAREYLKSLSSLETFKPLTDAAERIKEKACIVLIGSTAGKYGEAMHADYASSKSAMMYGLTLSLKNEIVQIAPKARVNCVAPGWVNTPMAQAALNKPDVVYRALATTPLKKVATPTDIANQIVILASSKLSGHITGQVLMVEGGMEGRLLNRPEDFH